MKKQLHLFYIYSFTFLFGLLYHQTSFGQEKKIFLQNRYDGNTETITKNSTKKELEAIKNDLASQGIFVIFSNLKLNHNSEIIRISIKIKNKKSDASININDKKPIPTIAFGENNGIVTINTLQIASFKISDLKNTNSNIFATANHKENRKNSPLYIIDGKDVSNEIINTINSKNIESITILKNKEAIKKYGKKGKYGVVILISKKE